MSEPKQKKRTTSTGSRSRKKQPASGKRNRSTKQQEQSTRLVALISAVALAAFILGLCGKELLQSLRFQTLEAAPQLTATATPIPTPTPRPAWLDNLYPTEDLVHATWVYQGYSFSTAEGVEVVCPIWYGVQNGEAGPELCYIGNIDSYQYMDEAHAAGIQVWGTVQSFDADRSEELLSDPVARSAFAEALSDKCELIDLDGICFDFEYMNPELKDELTLLVEETKALLGERTVSVCVTPITKYDTGNWYQCYDHAALGTAADYICLMSYEVNSAHGLAGAIFSRDWLESIVQDELCEVRSDRVLLGVPFYCYEYIYEDSELTAPVEGGVHAYSLAALYKLMATGSWTGEEAYVKSLLYKNTPDEEGDSLSMKFIGTDGYTHIIYYDLPDTLTEKAQWLCDTYSLGGTCVWVQSYGCDELWEALAAVE